MARSFAKSLPIFTLLASMIIGTSVSAEKPFGWCNGDDSKAAKVTFETGERYFKKKDYEWAWNFFLDAAKQCNREAMARMGLMAWNGLHVTKDSTLASILFQRASDLGDPKSQLLVGSWHKKGEFGLQRDLYKARSLFQKSFDRGVVEAGEQLGHAYFYGWGGEQSIEKAITTYLRTDAMGGTPFNSMQLGFMHNMGLGVRLDDNKAIAHYKSALLGGETDAASGIALVYDLNDLYEPALLWLTIDIELNGMDGIDPSQMSDLVKKIGSVKANKMRARAQQCIRSNYKNCMWPNLNLVRFKPLRSLRVAFNEFSFQDRSAIQYHLKKKGIYRGDIDGIWGNNTANSVASYAQQIGIPTRNSAHIYSNILKLGPAPKFKKQRSAPTQTRSSSDNALLKAMIGAIALSSGQNGFVSGLAGHTPKPFLYDNPSNETGYRNLNINGNRLNCFYYEHLNAYTNCR